TTTCDPILGRKIVQGDIGPLSGEGDRDGGSDSRVRAGDERPAAAKPACAGVAVLTAICAGNEVGVESRFRLVLLRRCDVGISSGGVLEGQLRSEEHTSELQSRFDLVCGL